MLFKQAVGMTANQYIATVRIGKAKDLLLSGEMNVSEAADAVGYRDVFYFSRQFKAVTGHPPSFYIP
jgi:YesN/AraC family two-component response regulator